MKRRGFYDQHKNKKSAKQKKVLVASILLAGLIVAGGTFAWFTSTDEVTNQLSASNDYGVAITETFTPPSEWTPGQEVNKDVGAVNTGNVDAFVKLNVSNTLDLTTLTSSEQAPSATIANNTEYVTLGTAVDSATDPKTGSTTYTVDDVTSLQAGGVVAGAWDGTDTAISDVVGTKGTGFKPTTTGLYIFRRDIDVTANESALGARTYEYAGYYFVDDSTSEEAGKGTYYALAEITPGENTIEADGYLNAKPTVKYQTTKTVTVTPNLTYVAADGTNPAYIKAVYDPNGSVANDEITINIKLTEYADGLTTTTDTWSIPDTDKTTFYYNKLIAAGATSDMLIDSVELDKSVSDKAYKDFDYNLKITLDSVQVVLDSNGDQTDTAVKEQWAEVTPTLTSTGSPSKIESIEWAKKTT